MLHNGNTVYWWHPMKGVADEEDAVARSGALLEETSLIEQRQHSWHELNLWNTTLYTNREVPGFHWGAIEDAESELWPTNLRTENLVEEIGDAMISKASSSPLKPTPTPHGQSYRVERAVRLLDQFILGVWRQTHAEDAAVLMFRDAYLAGFGCVQVAYDKKHEALSVDSVFFDNVIIDNRECSDRRMPRTYRVRRAVPRGELEARYGVDLTPAAGKTRPAYHPDRACAEGWEIVVEAWRLPGPDGKGGRHMVACQGHMLADEPWKHAWVPLVFFHWTDRTSGFFSKSGVEQVVPFQVLQNELNDDIREAQDIACRPRMAVNANSMIDVSQWDNKAGRFMLWSGSQPEPIQWPTNLAELYQERERNRAAAFSHMAMSEMFANADLPPGVRLDSSAGVREMRNMEDGRHLRLWTRFERARMDISKTILNVLANEKGADAFRAVYHPGRSRGGAKHIPWEAVKTLTDDEFSWTMEAVPLSQMSPAARRELVRDWTSRGLLQTGSDEARRMEGNPNLERIEDLELASADDILRHLEILESGEYEAPSELTNTTLGVKKVAANYHRLKNYEDVEPEVLENHIKWVVSAVAIQQQATAPAEPVPFAPTQGMPGTNATTLPPPMSAQ